MERECVLYNGVEMHVPAYGRWRMRNRFTRSTIVELYSRASVTAMRRMTGVPAAMRYVTTAVLRPGSTTLLVAMSSAVLCAASKRCVVTTIGIMH